MHSYLHPTIESRSSVIFQSCPFVAIVSADDRPAAIVSHKLGCIMPVPMVISRRDRCHIHNRTLYLKSVKFEKNDVTWLFIVHYFFFFSWWKLSANYCQVRNPVSAAIESEDLSFAVEELPFNTHVRDVEYLENGSERLTGTLYLTTFRLVFAPDNELENNSLVCCEWTVNTFIHSSL